MNPSLTQDNEVLQIGDVVCFAQPINAYEVTALLVVKELRESRILLSDQEDMLTSHKEGYIVPEVCVFSHDVLKVA